MSNNQQKIEATRVLIICTVGLITAMLGLMSILDVGPVPLIATLTLWAVMSALIFRGLKYHRFSVFGMANTVTTVRAAGTALLAGLVPVANELAQMPLSSENTLLWGLSLWVLFLLALDGVDGFLARRSGLSSSFGARFDMEIDALLALVITLFLWQYGKAGIWVLGLGLMRYGFIVASFFAAPLRGDLFPSFRRKLICVVQLGALCLMLSPLSGSLSGTALGFIAMIALAGSFVRDIVWLYANSNAGSTASYPHN